MRHCSYVAIGLVVLLGLSSLIASCTVLDATRDEQPAEERRPYRIQVDMTADKGEADQLLTQVRTWWDDLPDDERPTSLVDAGLQPDIIWRQPYYRVRIGQFATRDAAEEALAAVKAQFSSAFIARERVPAARQ